MEIVISMSGTIKGLPDLANLTRTDEEGALDLFRSLTAQELRERLDFKTWLTKYTDEGRAIEDLAHVMARTPNGNRLFWAILTDAFSQDYKCLYTVLKMENARNVFGTFPRFLQRSSLRAAADIFADKDFIQCIESLRASVPKNNRPKKGAKPVQLKK